MNLENSVYAHHHLIAESLSDYIDEFPELEDATYQIIKSFYLENVKECFECFDCFKLVKIDFASRFISPKTMVVETASLIIRYFERQFEQREFTKNNFTVRMKLFSKQFSLFTFILCEESVSNRFVSEFNNLIDRSELTLDLFVLWNLVLLIYKNKTIRPATERHCIKLLNLTNKNDKNWIEGKLFKMLYIQIP